MEVMIIYWVIIILALIVMSPMRVVLPAIGQLLLMVSVFFLIPAGLLIGMFATGFKSQELGVVTMLYVLCLYAFAFIVDRNDKQKA